MSNFVSSLKKKIKIAEENNAQAAQSWSFERPKELIITEYDTIGSLLQSFSLHFQWWNNRWSRMDETHQNALIGLFGSHPQLLQHIWTVLDRNFDAQGHLKHEKWRFEDLQFTLFEKLGLLNDDVEVEIYRLKPQEETENV